jgi:hypothetical protein
VSDWRAQLPLATVLLLERIAREGGSVQAATTRGKLRWLLIRGETHAWRDALKQAGFLWATCRVDDEAPVCGWLWMEHPPRFATDEFSARLSSTSTP